MSVMEIKSVVAFVDSFVPNRCLQFGFYAGNDEIKRVIVGQDALSMGLGNWERPINAEPGSDVWRALFLAPLIASGKTNYRVAVSYPFALKSQFARSPLVGKHKIVLPDMGGGEVQKTITIDDSIEVPEAYAHATAFKELFKRECVVISVGFGTIEMGMVDRTGKVYEPRMASHRSGLWKAAKPFRDELVALKYDDSKTRQANQDHVFDAILSRVVDEVEGRDIGSKVNLIIRGGALSAEHLKAPAYKVLTEYAKDLCIHISDYIEKQGFSSDISFVVTGGGVNYPIIVDAIKATLTKYGYENVTVADKTIAKYSAALGLNHVALKCFDHASNAIGIDVGNNSVLYEVDDETAEPYIEIPKQHAQLTLQ